MNDLKIFKNDRFGEIRTVEENGKMKCPSCRKEIPTNSNFCSHCGKKQNIVCNCWVKEKPYNCGLDKCPGIRLYLTEKMG